MSLAPAAGVPAIVLLITSRRRAPLLLAALLVGLVAGGAAYARRQATHETGVPPGAVRIAGRVLVDGVRGVEGVRFSLAVTALETADGWMAWRGPRLAVAASPGTDVVAGEAVAVSGAIRPAPGWFRGDPVAGWVTATAVEAVSSGSPVFRLGNDLRERVRDGLDRWWPDSAAVLVAGFLTGDIADLDRIDTERLRRAGLSHFVAVSGSNVALFLTGVVLALGPLAWGPKRRALVGLAALVVFVVATRWEPSVVRAATMAGLVLSGRLAGFSLDAWTALGVSVAGLLVISPELAVDLGFQLSVAATAGVVAGARWFDGRRPRWFWTALGASIAAQVAVAPVLLLRIGTIPAAAPLANVMATPIVAMATIAGGMGTMLGWDVLTWIGVQGAGVVLWIASSLSPLPQLSLPGVVLIGVATAVWVAAPRSRLPIAAVAVGIGVLAMVPAQPPEGPELVVLDVGQGDGILLRDPSGAVVLVDGGPDARVLDAALRRYGVGVIDLAVVTHRHADHTTALAGLMRRLSIRRIWLPDQLGEGSPLDDIAAQAQDSGITLESPGPGARVVVGSFTLDVVGPVRRYASPNDGSLVLMVRASGSSVLLTGDIETFAQADLGALPADVMKVPHQGAATSDPSWLRGSAPRIAVISVGPNDFGHPSGEVIRTLEDAGAVVRRTDEEGDIVIRLDRL